jgi:hypothetical protein
MEGNFMRLNKNLLKLLYIHFFFFTVFLFSSCQPEDIPKGGPSYPSDIVTDVGTLKYIRTLWDREDISGGKKIDNEIWIYTGTLFKGFDKSASVAIQYHENNRYLIYSPYIIPKGDYINFLVGKLGNARDTIYYIARVHKATMERQYIRIPILDGRGAYAYCGNDDVFFESTVYDYSVEKFISYYYILNDTCDNVTEITEQEFHDLYSPNPDYVTDDEDRHYRLYKGIFEVSVDYGTTWHRNTIQSNYPRANEPVSVIIQNNSVFILCRPIFVNVNIGGGIHEFKWEMDNNKE